MDKAAVRAGCFRERRRLLTGSLRALHDRNCFTHDTTRTICERCILPQQRFMHARQLLMLPSKIVQESATNMSSVQQRRRKIVDFQLTGYPLTWWALTIQLVGLLKIFGHLATHYFLDQVKMITLEYKRTFMIKGERRGILIAFTSSISQQIHLLKQKGNVYSQLLAEFGLHVSKLKP